MSSGGILAGAKRWLAFGAAALAASAGGLAHAQADPRYMQIAELQIDPAQLDAYKAAVSAQAAAAIATEPGVLMLYAVSAKDDAAHVTVVELYADVSAYQAHLQSPHFKTYKSSTAAMVKSLTLNRVDPIMLAAKPH